MALTFDDGPWIYTSELLDLLEANHVKATFFVTGNNKGKGHITPYFNLIRRMYAGGHHIASHSWSHEDFTKITARQRHHQIVRNEIAFAHILGFFPTYFRPPYTAWNQDASDDLEELGYHVVSCLRVSFRKYHRVLHKLIPCEYR